MSYLSVGSAAQFQSSAPGLGCSVQPADPGVAPGSGGKAGFVLVYSGNVANPPALPSALYAGNYTTAVVDACTIASAQISVNNNFPGYGSVTIEVWDATTLLGTATATAANLSGSTALPFGGGTFTAPFVAPFVEASPGSLTVAAGTVILVAGTVAVSVAPFTKSFTVGVVFQPI